MPLGHTERDIELLIKFGYIDNLEVTRANSYKEARTYIKNNWEETAGAATKKLREDLGLPIEETVDVDCRRGLQLMENVRKAYHAHIKEAVTRSKDHGVVIDEQRNKAFLGLDPALVKLAQGCPCMLKNDFHRVADRITRRVREEIPDYEKDRVLLDVITEEYAANSRYSTLSVLYDKARAESKRSMNQPPSHNEFETLTAPLGIQLPYSAEINPDSIRPLSTTPAESNESSKVRSA